MDDEVKPIPINIDLAEDHYEHKKTLPEPEHSKSEDGGDSPTTGNTPKAAEVPKE